MTSALWWAAMRAIVYTSRYIWHAEQSNYLFKLHTYTYGTASRFSLYLWRSPYVLSSVFTSASSGVRTGQSVLSLPFVWHTYWEVNLFVWHTYWKVFFSVWRTYWTVSFVFTFRLAHVLDSQFCLYFSSGARTGQKVLSLLFVWHTYWTVSFVFTVCLAHVLDSQSFRLTHILESQSFRLAHVLDSQFCLYYSSGARTGKSIFSSGTRTGKSIFSSGARTGKSIFSSGTRTGKSIFSSGARTGQSVLSLVQFGLAHVLDSPCFRFD